MQIVNFFATSIHHDQVRLLIEGGLYGCSESVKPAKAVWHMYGESARHTIVTNLLQM